jgi:hypothetical protein
MTPLCPKNPFSSSPPMRRLPRKGAFTLPRYETTKAKRTQEKAAAEQQAQQESQHG